LDKPWLCGKDELVVAIEGVGPETPTTQNENGGYQSDTPYGFHLTDPHADFRLAEILAEGAKKYARDNWRKIEVESHLNHALQHIHAYRAGDKQDDHLGHALCRLHMAVAVDVQGGALNKLDDECEEEEK
jgi:hypothetical protein